MNEQAKRGTDSEAKKGAGEAGKNPMTISGNDNLEAPDDLIKDVSSRLTNENKKAYEELAK